MYPPLPSIDVKQGDTFLFQGYAQLTPNVTWTATSQVKNALGTAIATLTVTITSPVTSGPTAFTLAATSTSAWPVNTLYCDISFKSGTNVIHSPTFAINVNLPETTI